MEEKRANVRGKVEQETGIKKGECESKSGAGKSSAGEKRGEREWDKKGRM